jgi:hypothetical protein
LIIAGQRICPIKHFENKDLISHLYHKKTKDKLTIHPRDSKTWLNNKKNQGISANQCF